MQIVHGDLSINNIVIFREPLPYPPAKPVKSKKGTTTTSTNLQMTSRVTQSGTQQAQVQSVSAPHAGVEETILVVGVIIDYDYARELKIEMDRTSVCLGLNSSALVHTELFSSSGNSTFHVTRSSGQNKAWQIYS